MLLKHNPPREMWIIGRYEYEYIYFETAISVMEVGSSSVMEVCAGVRGI